MTATAWPFIAVDDRGVPSIEGTAVKVLLLVECHLTQGLDAVALAYEFPRLTTAQTHAALGYYYAHREECDELRQRIAGQTGDLLSAVVDQGLQTRLERQKSGT